MHSHANNDVLCVTETLYLIDSETPQQHVLEHVTCEILWSHEEKVNIVSMLNYILQQLYHWVLSANFVSFYKLDPHVSCPYFAVLFYKHLRFVVVAESGFVVLRNKICIDHISLDTFQILVVSPTTVTKAKQTFVIWAVIRKLGTKLLDKNGLMWLLREVPQAVNTTLTYITFKVLIVNMLPVA